MGVWSESIYGNDIACDVRDEYLYLLENGHSNEESYHMLCNTFKDIMKSDEKNYFWEALADTQWKVGRLTEDVKEKALNEIQEELSGRINRKRRNVLLKLQDKLELSMPKEKKFKNNFFERNLWNIGDIYAYQFHKDISKNFNLYGKFIVFQKVEELKYQTGKEEWILPRIQFFNQIFDYVPEIDEIKKLGVLPMDDIERFFDDSIEFKFPVASSVIAIRYNERDYVQKWFKCVGNTCDLLKLPYNDNYFERSTFYMKYWERDLCTHISAWNNVAKEKKLDTKRWIG